jgi:hypothetical protein
MLVASSAYGPRSFRNHIGTRIVPSVPVPRRFRNGLLDFPIHRLSEDILNDAQIPINLFDRDCKNGTPDFGTRFEFSWSACFDCQRLSFHCTRVDLKEFFHRHENYMNAHNINTPTLTVFRYSTSSYPAHLKSC